MNILFLSLLYHPDTVRKTAALSRTGLQNQANGFQWAMIDGIRKNQAEGETLSILNALPVGIYPRQYRKLFLQSRVIGDAFTEIGSLNLPYCKQKKREHAAVQRIAQWAEQSPDNRMVVLYSLYRPYLRAVSTVKKQIPDLKACVIVTDLPGGLGLGSGRTGLMKLLEYRMGKQSTWLAIGLDGFILLTKQMALALFVPPHKYCVIEGLISDRAIEPESVEIPQDSRPAVLYTGTLNRELGLDILLDAFKEMDDVQLWLCGKGDMEAELAAAQGERDTIRYFGFVSQAQAVYLQSKAAVLINPRTSQGAYTRYSFPSKTLEYMRAGKPVLCCKLEGIPSEYDAYLHYIDPQNAQGIQAAVHAMLDRSPKERDAIGQRAKAFALSEKNNGKQGQKALNFLRGL